MRLIETGRWLGLVPASVMRFGGRQMHLKVLRVETLGIGLCGAALFALALKVLIDDPTVQNEIAAKEARERKQMQRYEAKGFEEQEQTDEDVLRNVQPYKL